MERRADPAHRRAQHAGAPDYAAARDARRRRARTTGREPFNADLYGEVRRRWSWNTGVIGKVARSGRAVLLRDVTQEPDYMASSPDVRAELAVPVVHDDRALAVLVLDSPRSSAFGDGEVAFAQALCAGTAQPLRRALRYQELLESSTQLGPGLSRIPHGLC